VSGVPAFADWKKSYTATSTFLTIEVRMTSLTSASDGALYWSESTPMPQAPAALAALNTPAPEPPAAA
jgi:hypothetical protein